MTRRLTPVYGRPMSRLLRLAGLAGLLTLVLAGSAQAVVREVWIAAVPRAWNVVPNQRNAIEGEEFSAAETRLDTVVYQRYTRGWRRPWRDRRSRFADNDGIPGPLLRARVGDRIRVHFENRDTLRGDAHSMHFHGVHYPFGSDGSFTPGFSGPGADVGPGQRFTYELTATRDSVGVWPYHDHSRSMHESLEGGMYGALSIRGRHERRPDREFVVFFSALHGFEAINGRAFVGNTPVFRSRVGDDVQWDVLTLGDEFHTFHVHGHRWLTAAGKPQDTRTIGPAESFRVRFRERSPGTWLYHCHVEQHMMRGMIGLYRVRR
jgi:FtsP/CotA-like multicopper oxidase with cupredoxin domain